MAFTHFSFCTKIVLAFFSCHIFKLNKFSKPKVNKLNLAIYHLSVSDTTFNNTCTALFPAFAPKVFILSDHLKVVLEGFSD